MSSSIATAGYIRASSQYSDGDRRLSVLSMGNDKGKMGDVSGSAPANNGYVWAVVLFGAIGGFLFGMDQGNFAGAESKVSFADDFCYSNGWGSVDECRGINGLQVPSQMTTFQGWGASLVPLGAAAGAILFGPLIAGNLGRRAGLCIGSAGTIGAMLWSLHAQTTSFLLSRFVTGLVIGIVTYSLPMWTSEVAPANIRGALGTTMQLACVLGSLLAAGIAIPKSVTWKWMIICPTFPAAILAIGIYFFPESPRYLFRKFGATSARPVLQKLRQTDDVEDELMMIEHDIELSSKQAPWSTLWTDVSIRKRVFLACGLQWMQQLTGVNAIVGHGPKLFLQAGVPMDEHVAFFLTQAFNLAGTIVLLLVIDKLGRRTLLLIGAVIMFVFMIAAGFIAEFALEKDGGSGEKHEAAGWLLLIAVCIYFLGFAIAWGGIAWVYPSEIFPMDCKEKALSISVFNQWIANFVIAKITPPQLDHWGAGITFFFYSAFIAINFVVVYFFLPETKGVPLEEMDTLFGKRTHREPENDVHA